MSKQGGPDALLHFGRKRTRNLSAELKFGFKGYKFILEPTQDNRLMFAEEKFRFNSLITDENFWWDAYGDGGIKSGHFESAVESQSSLTGIIYPNTVAAMKSWRVYHFHDTSESALVKQRHGLNDNLYLRPDARNLAAFLARLQVEHARHYQRIVKIVRLVAPFFGDFLLRPQPDRTDQIELEWTEKGGDVPFKSHLLSDGTLRFICLATLLIQPEALQPETILIDEPELGLHPFAINLLVSLFRSTSKKRQIIVSTQSTDLLNEFSSSDVIVADRTEGFTTLQRLDSRALADWLSEYSLGELWQKNVLGGRPTR